MSRKNSSGIVLCIEGANVQDVFKIFRKEDGTLDVKNLPYEVIDNDILQEERPKDIVEHSLTWSSIVAEYVKTHLPDSQELIDAAHDAIEAGKGYE